MLPLHAIPENTIEALAEKLGQKLQATNTSAVSGEQILQLEAHPQVRQFILFQIFQEWKAYMQKARHPYFDNDHTEVAAAYEQLEVTLSNHIKVDPDALQALAKKAYYNTIWMLVSPKQAIPKFFYGKKPELALDRLEHFGKYVRVYDFLVSSLISHYREQNTLHIPLDDFTTKLEKAATLYAEKVQPLDLYMADTYEALTGDALPMLDTPAPAASASPTPVSPTPAAPAPAVAPSPAPPAAKPKPAQQKIADQFAKPKEAEPGKPLSAENLPLYKRFQYVQKVFGGDSNRFEVTINELNLLPSYEEAEKYLKTRIFNMPENAKDEKINKEFLAFVGKRFGMV